MTLKLKLQFLTKHRVNKQVVSWQSIVMENEVFKQRATKLTFPNCCVLQRITLMRKLRY